MKEALCYARVKAVGTVTGWSMVRSAVEMMRSGENLITFNCLREQVWTTSSLVYQSCGLKESKSDIRR
eukprot:355925-Chlamydomonas_euryale.AAC.1